MITDCSGGRSTQILLSEAKVIPIKKCKNTLSQVKVQKSHQFWPLVEVFKEI